MLGSTVVLSEVSLKTWVVVLPNWKWLWPCFAGSAAGFVSFACFTLLFEDATLCAGFPLLCLSSGDLEKCSRACQNLDLGVHGVLGPVDALLG
jgi:hypothetical protein